MRSDHPEAGPPTTPEGEEGQWPASAGASERGGGPRRMVQERVGAERAAWDAAAALADPSTRVLDVVGDTAPVVTGGPGPRLRWRPPRPEDVDADLVLLLGRADTPADDTVPHATATPSRTIDHPTPVQAAPTPPASGTPSAFEPTASATPSAAAGVALVAVATAADTPPTEEPAVSWRTLREVGPWLGNTDVAWWMTAQGLILWHRTHRFCSRCGAPTVAASAGWVRVCPREGRESYPRTDPAVIMGIRDDEDRLLLARSPAWPQGRRSVLAGFVEPGESLEDAVRREVAEEVGLRVGSVEYAGSQPWPFPASLMVGFRGWTFEPELRLDPGEIAEAEWYTREQVREGVDAGTLLLPGRMSIARRLVEEWFGQRLHVPGVDEFGAPAWHRPS